MSDIPNTLPLNINDNSTISRAQGEFGDRLLLEETSDHEINQAVLQPMFRTGPWFWVTVGVLVAIVAWGLFAWIYQIFWGRPNNKDQFDI